MTLPTLDLVVLLPQLIVLAAALLVLVTDAFARRSSARGSLMAGISLAALLAAGAAAVWLSFQPGEPRRFQAMAVADGFALLFDVVIVVAAVLGVLLAYQSIPRISQQVGSYYALLLLAVVGMMTMGAALDLIVVFLALEILSLALYILAGFNRSEPRSAEASLKYFLLGAFASAFFLYGAALVYGATASLNLEAIAAALAGGGRSPALLYLGVALLIVGFGFKVALVPFHMWTPDVYEGAPTPVTGFMSAATKAVALILTLRVLETAFPQEDDLWTVAVAVIACASLAVGNLAALVQRNLKRLLAYSSIAQAGFMLIAVAANDPVGDRALLYYLIPYSAASLGAFAVVAARERELGREVTLDNVAGLGWERPLLGIGMWTFMLGFAGFPLTGGFVGKFYLFSAAYERGWTWLVIVGVVATMVSLYYYLGVIRALYMRTPAELRLAPAGGSPPRELALHAVVLACTVVVVGSFIAVEPLIDWAEDAVTGSLPL